MHQQPETNSLFLYRHKRSLASKSCLASADFFTPGPYRSFTLEPRWGQTYLYRSLLRCTCTD